MSEEKEGITEDGEEKSKSEAELETELPSLRGAPRHMRSQIIRQQNVVVSYDAHTLPLTAYSTLGFLTALVLIVSKTN